MGHLLGEFQQIKIVISIIKLLLCSFWPAVERITRRNKSAFSTDTECMKTFLNIHGLNK